MSEDATLDRFLEESDSSKGDRKELDPKVLTGVFDGWQKTSLAEVAESREESFVDGPFGANLLSEEYYEEGFARIIKLQNIRPGNFIDTNKKYITEEKFRDLERHSAYPSEIAIAKMAEPVARACILPDFENRYILAAADVVKLDTGSEFSNVFVMHSLNSYPVWKQAFSRARGTGRKRINLNQLKEVQIPNPPLPEQRKIATVLYTVDRAVEKTESIIDQISTVKEGVKDNLLTGGLRDAETTETRLGPVSTKIPIHWDTGRIGDLFTDRQLGTDERGSTEDGENIGLIKMGNLDFGTWDLSEVEKIEKDPQLLKEAGLQRGDLLFNTRNTPELVGKTAVWEFEHEAVYDNNLLRLRFGEQITSGHFVNAYLSSNIGRRQLRGRVHGTTSVAAIYWTDLQQVEIPVPPKEEQREIVDTLRGLDRTRKHNESYRNRLQRLKRGLMQDLLSGTVRTTDTTIEVPEEIAQYG
jgi:type I restriction enzyme S subunit